MGVVYLGNHVKIDRKVAIKVLNPALATNTEIRQRFLNEAKTLSNLTHQNIVTLFDFIEQDDNLCLVMEFVEGIPLDTFITKQQGPIPELRSIKIFTQVLDGFNYAHNKGIIHRDIKPSNIMLQADDMPKILDFGIAKILNADLNMTRAGTRIGSIYYMSPEQILGERVDQRSDIYSLGITIFEMLTAKRPYDIATSSEFIIQDKIVKEPLPSPRSYYPAITEAMEYIVYKATAKNPNDRFQSCSEFKEALLRINITSSYSQTATGYAGSQFGDRTMVSPQAPPQSNFINSYQTPVSQSTTGYSPQSINSNPYQSTGYNQNPPPIQPPQVPQQPINAYTGYGITPKKKNSSGLIAGIIVGIIVLFAGIGVLGYFGYNYLKDNDKSKISKNEDVVKNNKDKEVTKDTKKDEINYSSSERFPGAKLYFCERYDPTDGEIGVSNKFSTGYLTVMVDLRPSKKKIGISEVSIRLTKIKDADGNHISEKIIKTIPFTIQPTFDYVFFENKKELKFTSPGTYRATLMDKEGNFLVSGEIEIGN